ncbi:hypothetical protein BFW01_g10829 [Lasiodiplodia theobromae]|uniref:Uncharacterized protein n=1 Tax=Lasiodiplodia theobromae TaxID=45133 RepID=A0A8H7IQ12_9PEZI|nr:hypothetical protein BFW01_g10829 [Lasiodiplodia theobromae]
MDPQEQFLEARTELLAYFNSHLRDYLDGRPGFSAQLILISPRQEFMYMVTLWCEDDSFHQHGIACEYTVSSRRVAMEKLWELVQ